MKKLKLNNNAFAMAEFLIVAVIVLVIFSLLFSNYLPLVGKYENNMHYNSVTAQYSSFYIRKIYKSILEKDVNSYKHITEAIDNNGYYEVYSKDKALDDNAYKKDLEDLIYEYGIEEIIISKSDIKDLKEKYTRDKLLYNYIDYLPLHNSNNEYQELYRIILKTQDYGYATTEILTDELSNTGCFELVYENDGFAIKNYLSDKEGCSSDVVITDEDYTVKGQTGKINKILDNAFKGKNLTSVTISKNIKEIGASAFENNNLKEITIENSINYKERVFANNNLSKITIEDNVKSIPKEMFYCDKKTNNNLTIESKTITSIKDKAFKNTGIIEINLPKLEEIGNEALAGNDLTSFEIPLSIKSIGSNIFGNTSLGNKKDEITVKYDENNKILDNASFDWCDILYGKSCTIEVDDTIFGYKYTSYTLSKYITYVVGDTNE